MKSVKYRGERGRLDKFLAQELECSRTYLEKLFRAGLVQVDGMVVKGSFLATEGMEITYQDLEVVDLPLEPHNLNLEIVYEDQYLVVLNKPKGISVHPHPAQASEITLVHGLLYQIKQLSGIGGVKRPGIVHRLDKDTSGLMLVAKDDVTHQLLSRDLEQKRIKRQYLALVHGVINHRFGTIEAPIGRDPQQRQRMAVTPKNSKAAITHFEVVEQYPHHTLVRCQLETGRTHQIRVHLAYIKHPVVGDPKYGTVEEGLRGQLLHSESLQLIHPITKEELSFTVEVDEEFANYWGRVRAQS